jgi:hypothetical protein
MQQFGLKFVQVTLSLPALGEITDKAGELTPALEQHFADFELHGKG